MILAGGSIINWKAGVAITASSVYPKCLTYAVLGLRISDLSPPTATELNAPDLYIGCLADIPIAPMSAIYPAVLKYKTNWVAVLSTLCKGAFVFK